MRFQVANDLPVNERTGSWWTGHFVAQDAIDAQTELSTNNPDVLIIDDTAYLRIEVVIFRFFQAIYRGDERTLRGITTRDFQRRHEKLEYEMSVVDQLRSRIPILEEPFAHHVLDADVCICSSGVLFLVDLCYDDHYSCPFEVSVYLDEQDRWLVNHFNVVS